jgi:hypothetical protein
MLGQAVFTTQKNNRNETMKMDNGAYLEAMRRIMFGRIREYQKCRKLGLIWAAASLQADIRSTIKELGGIAGAW